MALNLPTQQQQQQQQRQRRQQQHHLFLHVSVCLSETIAEIIPPTSKYVKAGSSLRLACRVYLGEEGPDEAYKSTAVVHWFQDQRLLDPALDEASKSRISVESVVDKELKGWLQIDNVTPYDAGNYTCVPSYAIPAWTEVHILHGMIKKLLLEILLDMSTNNIRKTSFSQFFQTRKYF